jgi:hypothetical protein
MMEETIYEDSVEEDVETESLLNEGDEIISLTFRKNRKYDLHIGRKMHTFQGRESKDFPKSILDHKDFTESVRKNFVIKEKIKCDD